MSLPPTSRRSRWSPGVIVGVVMVGIGVVLVVVGLARAGEDVAAPTATVLPPVDGPFAVGRQPLPGFGEVAIEVEPDAGTGKGAGHAFCVLVARTEVQQQRGLMTVTDRTLGGYDGMLFIFSGDTSGAFWMRDTPMPLSIAYLAADGSTVSVRDMDPCGDRVDCPGYPPERPYRMALEVPRGELPSLGIGAHSSVSVTGRCEAKT